MGWLFYTDGRVQNYADEKAEIARLCTCHGDTRKTELVKACKVGSTWYAAARVTNRDGTPVEDATYVTDPDGSITFAAVFLTAARALDLRRPLDPAPATGAVVDRLRQVVEGPGPDRVMAAEIAACTALLADGAVLEAVTGAGIDLR